MLRALVRFELTPWVFGRYAASRETAASAVLRGGAKDLRFMIYEKAFSTFSSLENPDTETLQWQSSVALTLVTAGARLQGLKEREVDNKTAA